MLFRSAALSKRLPRPLSTLWTTGYPSDPVRHNGPIPPVQVRQTRPKAASSSVVAFAAYIWNGTARHRRDRLSASPDRQPGKLYSHHLTATALSVSFPKSCPFCFRDTNGRVSHIWHPLSEPCSAKPRRAVAKSPFETPLIVSKRRRTGCTLDTLVIVATPRPTSTSDAALHQPTRRPKPCLREPSDAKLSLVSWHIRPTGFSSAATWLFTH